MVTKLEEKGQSTLEFLITFSAAVGFIFMFVKMAMNYTDGYMVHHATFMAARSYLVVDEERDSLAEGDQRAKAKADEVFRSYLPEGFIKGVSSSALEVNSPEPTYTKFHAFVGLYIQFQQRFSVGYVGGKSLVTYVSEAFLGREPTRSETKVQTCLAIKSLGLNSCNVHVTLDDNGG